MKQDSSSLLQTGLAHLGIEDPQERLARLLTRYIRELEIFNASFNLIKVQNTDELIIKHILDSLAPWKILAEKIDRYRRSGQCTLADIGSGPGLPGIPLACLFLCTVPDVRITLIERMHKRCTVLENMQAVLGLSNTAVLETEAENAPADTFDIAVFRAFRPLTRTMLATLQQRLRTGGILAAYKGKKSAIEEELHVLGDAVPPYCVMPLTVPFYDAERNLVIIDK